MLFYRSKGSDLTGSLSSIRNTAILTILVYLSLASAQAQVVKDQLNEPARFKVVLDAGHGGKDSGCLGSQSMEKDIALSIVLEIGDYITERRPLVDILYTRVDDIFVPLHERSSIANDARADLFVSVHCNGVADKRPRGVETFVMGLHTAEENLEVAKRENKSVLLEQDYSEQYEGFDPDSPLGHILLANYQNQHLDQSLLLAESVQHAMTHSIPIDRGVKQAGFVVLRRTTMPSILIEAGFLTNKEDEAILTDSVKRSRLATDLAQAIMHYVDETSKPSAVALSAPLHEQDVDMDASPLAVSYPSAETVTSQYALQIGAFAKAITPSQLSEYEVFPYLSIIQDEGLSKVRVGRFTDLASAIDYQKVMRARGFRGAFVVAIDPTTVQ